jgi:hypothetical protein
MNINLSLSELNQLYYAMTRYEQMAEDEAKKYPSDFFNSQLTTAKLLTTKVQDALWNEVKVVDDAIDFIRAKRKVYTTTETIK